MSKKEVPDDALKSIPWRPLPGCARRHHYPGCNRLAPGWRYCQKPQLSVLPHGKRRSCSPNTCAVCIHIDHLSYAILGISQINSIRWLGHGIGGHVGPGTRKHYISASRIDCQRIESPLSVSDCSHPADHKVRSSLHVAKVNQVSCHRRVIGNEDNKIASGVMSKPESSRRKLGEVKAFVYHTVV